MIRYDPWSVLWVDFDPQVGQEQAGRRPAVVVGSGLGMDVGDRSGLVTVIPCTTRNRGWAWHVPVMLEQPSFAMCEQLRAISRQRIRREAQDLRLRPEEVDTIRLVLRKLLGL